MDKSPILHAASAMCVQAAIGLATDNWIAGAAIGCTFFIAREHTQAEYRWIRKYGNGKRENMPLWGGLDIKVWDVASAMDFIVPILACVGVMLIV